MTLLGILPDLSVLVEVDLAPVHNALASLALLNYAEQLPQADAWIAQTAAALTDTQRRTNRLVFEGFAAALIPTQEWPDLPAYLDDLEQQPPIAVRDRALDGLLRPSFEHQAQAPARSELLEDVDRFIAHLSHVQSDQSFNMELLEEMYVLLNDPPALQQLLVSHLRMLWDSFLAQEWQRRQGFLQGMVNLFKQREWPNNSAIAAIETFIGRDVPPAISMQLQGVRRVVFVLSPHIGLYASRFGDARTIWVFVRGRIEDLPIRQAPFKRVELLNPLSALADETRLSILELLGQHEQLLAQEIIARLDLSQSSISRHLKQLTATGFLIEQRGEGANKSYRLNPDKVAWTFRALQQLLSGAQDTSEEDARAGQPAELRRFLDKAGRVLSWPAKRKDQITVLHYLASRFVPGQEYNEREVNALLNQWHTFEDPATLRRDMYDEHMLDRTRDGTRYWRGAQPTE